MSGNEQDNLIKKEDQKLSLQQDNRDHESESEQEEGETFNSHIEDTEAEQKTWESQVKEWDPENDTIIFPSKKKSPANPYSVETSSYSKIYQELDENNLNISEKSNSPINSPQRKEKNKKYSSLYPTHSSYQPKKTLKSMTQNLGFKAQQSFSNGQASGSTLPPVQQKASTSKAAQKQPINEFTQPEINFANMSENDQQQIMGHFI